MIIDCDTCEVRDKACGDCVVSFLTIPVRAGASAPSDTRRLVMDADQEAAVEALVAGGLVPPLRLLQGAAPPPGAKPLSVVRRRAS
ncbi:hypothetical protein [Demequina aurantiaca]|uniref:hypothetical protein n=1 Tax=Demequina aurantiaca TaxID=676200 RepID=UPI003D32FE28